MDLSKYEGLLKWEEACEELAYDFLEELYSHYVDGEQYHDDSFWVGEEIGGVLSWGDYFVDMGNIVDYFRYNYTPDKFFEWYDYALDCHEKEGSPINMRNYLKLKTNS